MRYCGSKAKFRKDLIPIITKHLDGDNVFVDAFMGGANILSYVGYQKKIGIDINQYIIALWAYIKDCVVNGKEIEIPSSMDADTYIKIKESYINLENKYPDWLIGYTGSSLSFGSSWFNGFANYNPKRKEDHVKEAYNGIMKQIKDFKYIDETIFLHDFYSNPKYKNGSVVYCDPPYLNTKRYISDFRHDIFWDWVRFMATEKKCFMYVSEYEAPNDFKCIWEKEKKDGMGSSTTGISKTKIEKLFVYGKCNG